MEKSSRGKINPGDTFLKIKIDIYLFQTFIIVCSITNGNYYNSNGLHS